MADQVSVTRIIPAPAAEIFDLLADPDRHTDIDGSGTVRGVTGRPSGRLKLGSVFGMSMKMGIGYSTRNVVVEFDEGRLIAWQTLAAEPLSKIVTGRVWRYVLEPVPDGTRVTETWDISAEAALSRPFVRLLMAGSTRTAMERTLERIEHLVTDVSPSS